MTYSAEFIVNVGQFEHVQLTVDGQDFLDMFFGKDVDMEVALGDYHASLKAAVLYGRDQAHKALYVGPDSGRPAVLSTDAPEETIEELIVTELDAKVLDVQDKSIKPWERPVEAAPVKPWDVAASQSSKPADDPFADF